MLELGRGGPADDDFQCGYRYVTTGPFQAAVLVYSPSTSIYISGDTLLIDELAEIPKRYTHADKPIDLMLIHLGGTTIPGPSLPLLMVTMDDKQGIELVRLINPDVTIPIHYEYVFVEAGFDQVASSSEFESYGD